MSVENYYGNVNHSLLQYMPSAAKVLLEVGCGAGELAKAYKLTNPKGYYIGIELFDQAAELARQHLDRVICGDVEKMSLAEALLPGEQVDCLIYGDVLEHLRDPWQVLRDHVGYLAPGGSVVACIPNIQHWKTFGRLFFDKWQYSSSGLLDKTHLRFFALEDIIELFTAAGLFVDRIYSRVFELPGQEKTQKVLMEAAKQLGVADLANLQRRLSAIQYVVVARKNR